MNPTNTIAYYVLVTELFFIPFLLALILVHRWVYIRRSRQKEKVKKQVDEHLLQILTHQKPFDEKEFGNYPYRILLSTLEQFHGRFSDEFWIDIKNRLVDAYLRPYALKKFSSPFWIQRQWAARIFSLNPRKEDTPICRNFLNDTVYLIRITAISPILAHASKDDVSALLIQMMRETPTARYPYRDALMKSPKKIYEQLCEILKEERRDEYRTAILDLLQGKVVENLLPLIEEDLSSSCDKRRLAAVKILANYPKESTVEKLLAYLEDAYEAIRAEALKGLGAARATHTLPQLERSLSDPVWWVRLQGALALCKMGHQGMALLSKQASEGGGAAYRVAQYVLALPRPEAEP